MAMRCASSGVLTAYRQRANARLLALGGFGSRNLLEVLEELRERDMLERRPLVAAFPIVAFVAQITPRFNARAALADK